MSIWKRGTNLVKGMIAEASKSEDSAKMRALEKELQEDSVYKPRPKIQKQDAEEQKTDEDSINEENKSDEQNSEKILKPKKRTI